MRPRAPSCPQGEGDTSGRRCPGTHTCDIKLGRLQGSKHGITGWQLWEPLLQQGHTGHVPGCHLARSWAQVDAVQQDGACGDERGRVVLSLSPEAGAQPGPPCAHHAAAQPWFCPALQGGPAGSSRSPAWHRSPPAPPSPGMGGHGPAPVAGGPAPPPRPLPGQHQHWWATGMVTPGRAWDTPVFLPFPKNTPETDQFDPPWVAQSTEPLGGWPWLSPPCHPPRLTRAGRGDRPASGRAAPRGAAPPGRSHPER